MDNGIEYIILPNKNKELLFDLINNFEVWITSFLFEDYLPTDILNNILWFKKYWNEKGFILLKNLPTDYKLWDTWILEDKSKVSEWILELLGSIFWDIFFPYNQRNWDKVQSLYPKKEHVNVQSGTWSNNILDWHTEFAELDNTCSFLLIYCVRWDKNVWTKVIKPNIDLLDTNHLLLLQENKFIIETDMPEDVFFTSNPKAIIELHKHKLKKLSFDPIYTCFSSIEHEKAFMELKNIIDTQYSEVFLEEWDLLIVDNRVTCHSRWYLKAKFDGKDRWLQRICII